MEDESRVRRPGRLWVGVAIGVVVIALAIAMIVTLTFGAGDGICKGVVVSGVRLGGLTRTQAEGALSDWAKARANKRVILTALDSRWIGKLPDFGARVEWRKAVDRAYSVGRTGNIVNRMIRALTSGGSGKHFTVPVAVDETQVARTVSKVARAVNRPHKDARLREADGRLEIVQDEVGIKLVRAEAVKAVTEALRSDMLVVPLPVVADKPDVSAQDAAGISTLLARFTTPFNPGKRDRTHNLTLSARCISGVIIKPGMKFSYNTTVGPRVLNRGFREAPIFVKGKMEPGVGGGICQVSSTLYNAVLLAGLRVIERHPHSRTVPYVRPGRDATVAYGLRDFKFENTSGASVGVLTRVSGARLTVDIYGAPGDKKKIDIITGPVKWSGLAGLVTIVDANLPPGARKIVDKGSRGASVIVYRKITAPDGSVTTEVISKDRYPARGTVVTVGPARRTPEPAVIQTTPASAATLAEPEVRTD